MQFQAAEIIAAGRPVIVVRVKKEAVDTGDRMRAAFKTFKALFPNKEVVLMSRDIMRQPVFFGTGDVTRALEAIPEQQIPWMLYETKS